ncbi:unnamed protein product, partial [Urochloa humidicola]
ANSSISSPPQELVLVSPPLPAVHALPAPSPLSLHPPSVLLLLLPARSRLLRCRPAALLAASAAASAAAPRAVAPAPDGRRSGAFLDSFFSRRCAARRLFLIGDRAGAGMNTRPVVLVLLLLVLIITSQFEWKQQIGDAADADPAAARRRQQLLAREDAVKEKIILSQEKNIQQLNQLIESLQRQLLHCRGSNNTVHTTTVPAATEVGEVEEHETIDDENR